MQFYFLNIFILCTNIFNKAFIDCAILSFFASLYTSYMHRFLRALPECRFDSRTATVKHIQLGRVQEWTLLRR